MNSTKAARVMAGIPKRKENLAASLRSQPETRAVEIVTPDLDTPGKMAKAWEIPIRKLSEYLWFFKFIEPLIELSAMYMNIAIRKETSAIDIFERRILSKISGKNNFILPPNKIIGIVPIRIDLNNLSYIKFLNKFSEYWLFNLDISFLKYQIRAKTLPIWIIAERDGPGSLIPKKRDTTFKWAVLLTGINSVKPWIKPYRINSKYSKKIYKSLN